MNILIQTSYLLAVILFIVGLRQLSSPVTARHGITWAGWGMLLAVLVTLLMPGLSNYVLLITAIVLGAALAWYYAKVVPMTAMPQVTAIYNGMGGGAAAAIAAIGLIKNDHPSLIVLGISLLGALIGTVTFSGSLIAFLKLQEWYKKTFRVPFHYVINIFLLLAAVACGIKLLLSANFSPTLIIVFYALSFVLGIWATMPIGGANMPLVISLLNALTGLAVGFEGFVLGNPAMMIAGIIVGASGTLLTQLMATAMNRSIATVLFSSGAQGGHAATSTQSKQDLKPIDAQDAAIMLAFANKVIVVPGYGLAVAQAQHKLWELVKRLEKRNVVVKFAIHPVAGRMPGHMNVLLAEAGVPYDKIFTLEEINEEFPTADVALVIGANDVVNPAARNEPSSPIYEMPILNVDHAKNVLVIKRGEGKGFSGVENSLFYLDKTRMLYGDAQQKIDQLIQAIATL